MDEHGEHPRWQAPDRRVRRRQPGVPAERGRDARQGDPPARSRTPTRGSEEIVEVARSFWAEETACVALEVPLPVTRHGWKMAAQDMMCYMAHALKKRTAEVHERHMDAETRERFRAAKMVEVKKFLVAQALE